MLPEKQCHVIETPQALNNKDKPLDITSAFDLIKIPLTATLAELEKGVITGPIDDTNVLERSERLETALDLLRQSQADLADRLILAESHYAETILHIFDKRLGKHGDTKLL